MVLASSFCSFVEFEPNVIVDDTVIDCPAGMVSVSVFSPAFRLDASNSNSRSLPEALNLMTCDHSFTGPN
jgi:hypothetical protein